MRFRLRGLLRSYGYALVRSRKDRRARKTAIRVTLLLVYMALYLPMMAFVIVKANPAAGIWDAVFYAVLIATGALAAILLRRQHRKQDELFAVSLTGQRRNHPDDRALIAPAVHAFIAARLQIVAVLFARGANELYLREHPLPPGEMLPARGNLNTLLRQRGLWEQLDPTERDLLGAPEGAWTPDQQNQVIPWCEQLRLLRWVLGIDAELMPLAHFPGLDFALISAGFDKPVPPAGTAGTPMPWDVRVERDVADGYLVRLVAELRSRGLITNMPELDGWTEQFRAQVLGPSTDYLAGARTVGELTDEALRQLAGFAAARLQYADYLVNLLSADTPAPFFPGA